MPPALRRTTDVSYGPDGRWHRLDVYRPLGAQGLPIVFYVHGGGFHSMSKDTHWIMGLGFAPQTGGTISLIDQVGIKQFVAECDSLAQKYGAQFAVPKLLRDMAAKGESFYGKRQAKAA
mgnify:CR=1 FL=1